MVHHGTPKGKEAQIGNGVVRVYDLFAIFDNLCVSLPKESPKFNGERVRLMIGHELGRNWISQISHDIRMAPASSEKKKTYRDMLARQLISVHPHSVLDRTSLADASDAELTKLRSQWNSQWNSQSV